MKKVYLLFLSLVMVSVCFAQNVEQESLEWRSLWIRPTVSMTAPLSREKEIVLPMQVNVDARYELGKLADVNAGLSYGTFKGVTFGGTYHLSDQIVNKRTRFIVAQTSNRVYFYKGRADRRQVFGPAVNVQLGSYSDAGFYGRFDAGITLQRYSRAYYDSYPSAVNGYTAFRLMATFSKFNQFEYGTTDGLVGRAGAGILAGYQIALKPWKRITLFSDIEGGYVSVLGVKDYDTGYVVMNNTKWNLLLGLKLGISVSLL